MLERVRNSIGPIVGYHGCEKTVGESLLAGTVRHNQSNNAYDWLGPGIYFWMDSPERALEWAIDKQKRGEIKEAFAVGALVHLGLCLNLTDYGVNEEIRAAYADYAESCGTAGLPLVANEGLRYDLSLRRYLDCAVIQTLHKLRQRAMKPEYDTVFGAFEEGKPLFPGAGFREKTHIQIAVRNVDCILGYFRIARL